MKKKGFATSAILYTMLLLFLVVLVGILNNLQNKKVILDALKEDTIKALQQDSIIDSVLDQIGIMNNKIVELEAKNEELINRIQENKLDMYTVRKNVSGTNSFSFQTRVTEWQTNGNERQSIFIIGSDNGIIVKGLLIVAGNGTTKWSGEGDITFTKEEKGRIKVNLPYNAWDLFLLTSPDQIAD